ncbi:hypothetical protein Tco_0168045 [Tanacetum coccineum]
MDSYRDEEMGDIIIGRPFCKDACIKAIGFDGMITIYKGNNSVTYQMAQSHPRFKHLTNVQCSKMRPLLKVSVQDELKGISHPYQKLKGFYKEVLNLGPEYIKDDKVEEWLTRGHTRILELKREISRIVLSSDYLYVVSNKEDIAYLCLHFTRNHEELKSNMSEQVGLVGDLRSTNDVLIPLVRMWSLFTLGPAWDWLTFQKHPGDSVPSVFKASMLHIPGWKSKFIFVCEDLFSDQNPGIVTPFKHRLGTFSFPFPS